MDAQDIVHVEVHLKTCLFFNKFQNWDTGCWDKDQGALLCYFLNHWDAGTEELMLVVLQFIADDTGYIDIWLFNIPKTVLTATKSTDSDLSSKKSVILSIIGIFEGILDVSYDSISDL